MDILCCSWQQSFGFAYVHVGGAVYIAGRGDGNILVGEWWVFQPTVFAVSRPSVMGPRVVICSELFP